MNLRIYICMYVISNNCLKSWCTWNIKKAMATVNMVHTPTSIVYWSALADLLNDWGLTNRERIEHCHAKESDITIYAHKHVSIIKANPQYYYVPWYN